MAPSNKVYYSINIPYNEESGCDRSVATVQYESGDAILDRGSDYYVSIINFSIPVSSIPIFFVDIEKFPNTDINKTVYKIAMEYDGNTSTQNLIYYNSDLTQPAPLEPSATQPEVLRTMYHSIYTYTKFLDMLNIAYKAAYDALPTKPVGSTPPVFTFNPALNKFSVTANATHYKSSLADPIKIYMNYELYQFFIGFNVVRVDFKSAAAKDFRYVFLDDSGVLTQDYTTTANWNALRSIQLRADMMSTRDEYVPSVQSGSNGNKTNREPILASFNPLFSNSDTVPRSQITYALDSAHRLIDVITSSPITKLSLSVTWCDEKNNCYPLIMNYRELVQCKLCFHLKESYAG